MADAFGVLQGLAGLLQAAATGQGTAAAARAPPRVVPAQPQPAVDTAALASLISGLATALSGVAAAQAQQPAPVVQAVEGERPCAPAVAKTVGPASDPLGLEAKAAPLPSIEEFVASNDLEPWAGEAIAMLSPDQQAHVMRSSLKRENTNNLNGVITSRIKEVTSVEQRLQMFILLNGLGEGVQDRLSTLTPDQHEKVMESTLKVQKANNPSGVVMRRISDVLRNERLGVVHGPHMSSPGYRPQAAQPVAPAATLLTTLVGALAAAAGGAVATGGATGSAANRAADRSRSRPPAAAPAASYVPQDVRAFVEQYGLEWWVGEVLARLSLYQRQTVMTELGSVHGVRSPSGVVMTRVRQVCNTQELLSIFIDINQLDQQVSQDLWELSDDQQQAVIAPGIYIQNARSSSTAARSRIRQVLAGNDAMGGARYYRPQPG